MAEKKMYVVHTKRGYWIGAFAFNEQLRFAKIYTSLRFANETVERIKRAYSDELSPKVLEVRLCLAQNAPTADVVPKSEVERLTINMNAYGLAAKRLQEDVERLQDINNRQVEDVRLAKQEVAREIFAEIERVCIDTFGNFNHRVFAELKKKYESEGGE